MNCRHCRTPLGRVPADTFVDLGAAPPSNAFLRESDLLRAEAHFPLKVFACPTCALVQVDEVQRHDLLFSDDYVYFSSYSSSWLEHARRYVDEAVDYAVKLGVALQLTNILRDIGEDANRGRVYIPQQDLQRYGLSDEDIFQRRRTPQFKAMLRFQSARAHALYEAAWPGVGMLNPDSSLAIAAAATIYRGILDSIHSADYDVFTKRAYVPLVRKVGLLIGAYARLKRDFQ